MLTWVSLLFAARPPLHALNKHAYVGHNGGYDTNNTFVPRMWYPITIDLNDKQRHKLDELNVQTFREIMIDGSFEFDSGGH